jgi:competence protein ComEC
MSGSEVGERGELIRPALPLLLMPLGGLWAGLFCAQHLAWEGMRVQPPTMPAIRGVLVVAAVAVAALGLLVLFCRRFVVPALRRARPRGHPFIRHPFLIFMLAVLLGLGLGLTFWMTTNVRAQRVAVAIEEHAQERYSLVIREDPKQGVISKTSRATLEIMSLGTLEVRIFWNEQQEPLPLGTRLSARVALKPLSEAQIFLHQKGVFGSVTLEGIESQGFDASPLGAIYAFREHNRRMLADIDDEGSALLRGVLLGDTTELDSTEAGRAFKVTGLSHLVAVSGSHLVVIALLISWFIKRLGLRRSIEVAIITLLLVSYVFLTGLQPSAIRACVMTFIASLAAFVGRRGHIPSALAAAAFGMLLLYPPTAFSVGFWLSVYAVFGLTIFCPLVTRFFDCLLPTLKAGGKSRVHEAIHRAFIEPLALTATAQMATLPITAPLFATVSLVSPLANLLVTPFITLLVGFGIVSVCLMPVLGPLGPLVLGCLCAVANVSILLAGWCAQLPHACLGVSFDLVTANICALALAALIYHRWPQPSPRRCLVLLVSLGFLISLLCAAALLPVSPQVVMLDVGQGDAILIREGRSNILVDTGPSDISLLKALARQRVNHLDAVIITHLDDDHCGALEALSGTVTVDHIYFARGLPEAKASEEPLRAAQLILGKETPEALARGDTLSFGRTMKLIMLWPAQTVTNGGNDESICLALNYDADADGQAETRMLLTGDAESPQLASLLGQLDQRHFDILKVGHHGSTDAVSAAQLEQMACQLALISVGKGNHYGHPTTKTLVVLEQSDTRIYRTDLNGDIQLRFVGGSFFVRCDTIAEETQ